MPPVTRLGSREIERCSGTSRQRRRVFRPVVRALYSEIGVTSGSDLDVLLAVVLANETGHRIDADRHGRIAEGILIRGTGRREPPGTGPFRGVIEWREVVDVGEAMELDADRARGAEGTPGALRRRARRGAPRPTGAGP